MARYLLDCLTADQTAAIAKSILADASLSKLIEIKLPVHFVGNYGLPAEVLTTARTTYFRNAACEKSALLVANTGDDEEQSLKDLVSIGASELLAHPELWISIAGDGLPISGSAQTVVAEGNSGAAGSKAVWAGQVRRIRPADAPGYRGWPSHAVGPRRGAPCAAFAEGYRVSSAA